MPLTDLEEYIAHTEGREPDHSTIDASDKKEAKGEWIAIPFVLVFCVWFYYATGMAFCTTAMAVILSYVFMAAIYASRGGAIPDLEPELPEEIDIPEEFSGRPKLYLAYLVEQAAEQDELARVVASRGIDPTDKSKGWDRI